MTAARLGKIPTTALRLLSSELEPLEGMGAVDLAAMLGGEVIEGEDLLLSFGQQLHHSGKPTRERRTDLAQLDLRRRSALVMEDRPDRRRHHRLGRPGPPRLEIAQEMHPTP